MNRILILTKNLFAERYLSEQLQKLNNEVMISVSIWENWENSGRIDDFVKSFQLILLSETLTDKETEAFGKQFNTNCLLRIVGEIPSEEMISEWKYWHIFDWIFADTTLERLREKLLYHPPLDQVVFEDGSIKGKEMLGGTVTLDYTRKPFPLYYSDVHFTKNEKGVINQLMTAHNLSLTRDELCADWRSKNQNSKLSQLSSTIAKIRKKVNEAYGIEEAVITLWGEGYRLNPYFHRCLLKGEFQKKRRI